MVSPFPTSFNVGIFLLAHCVGVAQLVSGFLSDRVALCVAVHFVWSWEKGSSGASYVTIFKDCYLPNF